MDQYLLSVFQPGEAPADPGLLDEVMANLEVLNLELTEAGARVLSASLQPPRTATVLRPEGERIAATDGPFIETKEFLGGFTVIQASDLDEALEWGRKMARATTLPIEVRPLQEAARV